MGQIGDFFRLVLSSTYLGQDIKNVYWYQQLRDGVTIGDLTAAFELQELPIITPLQSDQVSYVDSFAENLRIPDVEFDRNPIVASGQITGDYLPGYMAWGFKLNRSTREVRNGSKRYVGVVEAMIENGVVEPIALVQLQAAAGNMGATLLTSAIPTWLPVVLRLEGNLSIGYTVAASSAVANVTFRNVTTQNSRKDLG